MQRPRRCSAQHKRRRFGRLLIRWSIACATDAFWEKLAVAIGRPEMAQDSAFATNAARVQHQERVIAAIEAFTTLRTKEEIALTLGGKVPFGSVYTSAEIFADRHYAIREMLVEVEQPGSATPVKIAGVPIKLSRTPGAVRRRAPLLGEHTEEILHAAGYSDQEITRFRGTGTDALPAQSLYPSLHGWMAGDGIARKPGAE